MPDGPTLAELGEWELIERLGAFAPPGQFSDDAALFNGDGTLVVNTDVLVDGVHFSDATTDPFSAGWRSAAANLSDLAAMGCTEVIGLTVGLVAPGSTPWPWVEEVYRGLKACLEHHGGNLLGGDCSSGLQRSLAVTALGRLERGLGTQVCSIRRGAGLPGDVLVCSGLHGLSRLGLALLQQSLSRDNQDRLPEELKQQAIQRHLQPVPRLDAVAALHASRPAKRLWRVAGTDSSDGLAAAAAALARASGCQALLDHRQLPLAPAMVALAEAEEWCLSGGEDFELVLALDADWAEALMDRLPSCRRIGLLVAAVEDEPPLGWLQLDDNPRRAEPLPLIGRGYTHFS